MTNREKLKVLLSERSPNGEKSLLKYMNDSFGCPRNWDINCINFHSCENCWKLYLESEAQE